MGCCSAGQLHNAAHKREKRKKSCTPWLKIITTKILDSSLPLCVEDLKKKQEKIIEKSNEENVCCATPPPPPQKKKKKQPTINYLDLVDILPPSPGTPLNQLFLFHWSAIFNTVKKTQCDLGYKQSIEIISRHGNFSRIHENVSQTSFCINIHTKCFKQACYIYE